MSPAKTTKNVPAGGTFRAVNAALGVRQAALLRALQRSGRAVVRLDRDRDGFGGFIGPELRKSFARLTAGGWLRRIERGTYAVLGPGATEVHQPLAVVADWLDGEEYAVTGFAALSHWDLTQHPATRIDILVTRWKRSVRYGPVEFRFARVARARIARAQTLRVPGARAELRIVSPERAVVDVAAGRHAVALSTLDEALERGLRFGRIQRRRLLRETTDARRAAVRRLGWLAERRDAALAERLRQRVGWSGYIRLDPTVPATGAPRNTRWRVLENAGALESSG